MRVKIVSIFILFYVLGYANETAPELEEGVFGKARIHFNEGRFDSVKVCLDRISNNIDNYESDFVLLNLCREYALLYNEWGSTEEVLQYSKRGLKASEDIENKTFILAFKNLLGTAFARAKNFVEAKKSFEEVIDIAVELKSDGQLLGGLSNLAYVYKQENDLEKAEDFFKRGLEVAFQTKFFKSQAIIYNNLANIEVDRKNYPKAIGLYLKSIAIAEKNNLHKQLALGHSNLSNAYLLTNNVKEAHLHAEQALEIASRHDLLNEKSQASLDMASVHYEEKNYKEAFERLNDHLSFKETLLNNEISRQVREVEAKYNLEKKEREVAEAKQLSQQLLIKQQEEKLKSNLKVFGLIISILLVSASLGFYLLKARNKKKLLLYKQDLMQFEIESQRNQSSTLKKEISFKNTELTNLALNISNRRDVLEEVHDKIRNVRNHEISKEEITDILVKVSSLLETEKDSEELMALVEKENHNFFINLNEKFPDLTKNDKRLCGLLRLNFSSKQISNIFNISAKSVDMSRYRLRKKLNMEKQEDIVEFLNNI